MCRCEEQMLRESAGLLPERSETLRPVAIKHDVLLSFKARDDVLVAYARFVNRALPDEYKPCPTLWQQPIFRTFAGNMPFQLRALGFDVLDPPEAPLCFQEAERFIVVSDVYSVARCCYDPLYNYIAAWPSRATYHNENGLWTRVEETDVEELLYKADALDSLETVETTTSTTTIAYNGIESAVSVYAGKLDIIWETFTDANLSFNSSDVKYFLLSSEEEEMLTKGDAEELLQNRPGVLVQSLESSNRSAQIHFDPGSTQFLLVLAAVMEPSALETRNIAFLSSNRQATRIRISQCDPVLKAGVTFVQLKAIPNQLETLLQKLLHQLAGHEINATESLISLAASQPDDLPVLTAGMYLSGLSSQEDPFFVQVMEVLETGPFRVQATVHPALVEDVYEKLQIDGVFTLPEDASLEANESDVSLLSKPLPKPVSKIQPKGDVKLELAVGVSVQLTMSFKPKAHVKVDIDGPSYEVDFKFTMKYESTLGFSLFTSATLTQTEEIVIPLKVSYTIPGPIGIPITLKPEVSFVGTITSSAKLSVGVSLDVGALWTVEVGFCWGLGWDQSK
eukprot:s4606_g1.t1